MVGGGGSGGFKYAKRNLFTILKLSVHVSMIL